MSYNVRGTAIVLLFGLPIRTGGVDPISLPGESAIVGDQGIVVPVRVMLFPSDGPSRMVDTSVGCAMLLDSSGGVSGSGDLLVCVYFDIL